MVDYVPLHCSSSNETNFHRDSCIFQVEFWHYYTIYSGCDYCRSFSVISLLISSLGPAGPMFLFYFVFISRTSQRI